ncbi:MAG TPA: choice-of-anchor C family protein [Tepidisphaeraceae bacterium]
MTPQSHAQQMLNGLYRGVLRRMELPARWTAALRPRIEPLPPRVLMSVTAVGDAHGDAAPALQQIKVLAAPAQDAMQQDDWGIITPAVARQQLRQARSVAAPGEADDHWLGALAQKSEHAGDLGATVARWHRASNARTAAREVVFVDSRVDDLQAVLQDLKKQQTAGRAVDVVVLKPDRDGLAQVTEALAGRKDVAGIHLISHGGAGEVLLGNLSLTGANLTRYAAQLQSWREALSNDADILVYGCDIAGDGDGKALIQGLADLTGADVSASTDKTGSSRRGGDWNLEFATGRIETTLAVSDELQSVWSGVLNVAVDAASSGSATAATSLTISHTTSGSNRLMLVSVATDPHGASASSVTYNGVALAHVGAVEQTGSHSRVELWALTAPALGNHNVVITMNATTYRGLVGGVMTFTGVDQTTPLLNFVGSAGKSASASANAVSSAGDLVFAAVHSHFGTSANPGAGQNEYWDITSDQSNSSGTIKAGAASVANSWTVNNDEWSAIGISVHAAVNTAPALDGSKAIALTAVDEDAAAPSGAVGTLVSSLVDLAAPSGQLDNVVDPDAGALLGIAVTAADTSKGSWYYSLNNGASWSALGAVSSTNARLLAADASTRLYFRPTADYNGSIPAAITFRAWDRTSGAAGATADTTVATASGYFLDAFTTISYANNDGSANWATDWIETDSGGGDAAGGLIQINGGRLSITPTGGANSVYRSANLNGQTSATLSLDYDCQLVNGQSVQMSISGNGKSATLATWAAGLGAGSLSVDISQYIGSSTKITLVDSGGTGGGTLYLDNVKFAYGEPNATAFSFQTAGASIAVNPLNDAPVNTLPGAQTTAENAPVTFSTARGNGISISDVDAGASAVDVTLAVSSGALSLSSVSGLTFTNGNGISNEVMSFSGTLSAINSALNGLVYTPLHNYSGGVTLSVASNDHGATGLGGSGTDTDNVAINVTAVSVAPVAGDDSYSINEDTPLVAGVLGNDSAKNRVVNGDFESPGVPSGGWSTYGAGSTFGGWTVASGSVDMIGDYWQAASGNASVDLNGAQAGAIYQDLQTLAGQRYSLSFAMAGHPVAPQTVQMQVWWGNTLIDTISFDTTGRSTSDMGWSDHRYDGLLATGATTRLKFVSLTASSLGPTLDDVVVSQLSPVQVTAPAHGNLSWNANGSYTYTPNLNYNGPDSFTYKTNDGVSDSNVATVNLTVNAVNDAPVNNVPGAQSMQEDGGALIFSLANGNEITISDLDAGGAAMQVTLSASGGVLTLKSASGLSFSTGDGTDDATMSFSGSIAAINAALDGLTYAPAANANGAFALSITTNDNGNTGAGGAETDSDSVAINISAVNDAPVMQVPSAQTTNEDVAVVFSSANGNAITVTDADAGSSTTQITLTAANGTLTLATLAGLTFTTGDGIADGTIAMKGTLAAIGAALEGLQFVPSANYFGAGSVQILFDDRGSTGSGGNLTASGTVNITIASVNDAPVNQVPANESFPEDNQHVFSSGNGNAITISDVDAGSATLEVTLSIAGGRLTLGNRNVVTITTGNGLNDKITTFWGTLANINTALNGLIFKPGGNQTGSATITITTNDHGASGPGGAKTTATDLTLTITPVNDAPVIGAPVSAAGAMNSSITFSTANGNAIQLDDVDHNGGVERVTLSAGQGALTLSSVTGLSFITGDGNADAVIVVEGTLANLNAALDGLKYEPAPGYTGSDTLSININDKGNTGAGGALSDAASIALSVQVPNKPPTISLPANQATDEDTMLLFSSLSGNAISISDSDAGANAVKVTLAASHGTLTLSSNTGLSYITGDGNDDATLVFTGTIADVNAALEGLLFVPDANFNGAASIAVTVDDQGHTGYGGSQAVSGAVSVQVKAINDTPSVSAPANVVTLEDTALVFSSGNGNAIQIGDADAGSGNLTVSLTTPIGRLTLANLNGLSFTTGDGTADQTMTFSGTLVAISAALDGLTFIPTADFNGSTVVQVFVQDQGNAGTGGTRSNSLSLPVAITAVNDAPVNQLPANVGGPEDQILVLSGSKHIAISDVDAGAGALRVTLTATRGVLTLTSAAGITFIAGDGTDDVTMTLEGTVSALNAALDSLRFHPELNFHGTAHIAVSTDDRGNAGGAALPDADTLSIDIRDIDNPPTTTGLDDVRVDEDAAPTVIDLESRVDDIDDDDADLDYAITSNSNATLFSSAVIDPTTHELKLSYAKDGSGVAHLVIRVTDAAGQSIDLPLTVQVDPINDAPVLAKNAGLTVQFAESTVITRAMLQVTDVDNTARQLTYTVKRSATQGSLSRNGIVLAPGDTFTQADIDASLIKYTHGGGRLTDSVDFTVADGSGGAIASHTFAIAATTSSTGGPQVPPQSPTPPSVPPTGGVPEAPSENKDPIGKYYYPVPPPPPITASSLGGTPVKEVKGGGGADADPAEKQAENQADQKPAQSTPQATADLPGKEAAPTAAPPAPTAEAPQAMVETKAPERTAPEAPAPAPANVTPVPMTVAVAPPVAPAPKAVAPPPAPAHPAKPVQFVAEAGKLWTELDEFHQKMTQETSTLHLVAGTASFVTFGMSLVYVLWTIRAGYLVASLLSTMPTWRVVDPLPILDHFDDEQERRRRRKPEDDDDSLESLLDKQSSRELITSGIERA